MVDQLDRDDSLELVKRLTEGYADYMQEVKKVIYGQEDAVECVLISLLCGSHCLLHGLPGLGKTKMASSIARVLDLSFCRIQFTPDLMPSDITGTDIISEDQDGRRKREFLQGPIFANLVLADEINRTPPKTQAALLEAMQEHQVSIGRETYHLQEPFMVLATENPIELEGTYRLPEAQLDRFMFSLHIHYTTRQEEIDIVKGTTTVSEPDLNVVLSGEEVLKLQKIVRGVPVSDDVIDYAVRLARASRPQSSDLESVKTYVSYGASTRASQYLILGAKAKALLSGRYHVDFDDVVTVAKPVLRHRILLNFRSRADNVASDSIVQELLDTVPKDTPQGK